MGKLDLNMLCVEVKTFESAEKKLQIQNIQVRVDEAWVNLHVPSTKDHWNKIPKIAFSMMLQLCIWGV